MVVCIRTCKVRLDSLDPITELPCPSVSDGPTQEKYAVQGLLTLVGISSLYSEGKVCVSMAWLKAESDNINRSFINLFKGAENTLGAQVLLEIKWKKV